MSYKESEFQRRSKKKAARRKKLAYSFALAGIAAVGIGAFSLSYGFIKNSSAEEPKIQEEIQGTSTLTQKQREELKKIGMKEKLVIEAGSQMPKALEFFENAAEGAEIIAGLTETQLKEIGEYPVTISFNGKEYQTYLEVKDTKPPAATAKKGTLLFWADEIKPEDLIETMTDATEISASFGKIDFNRIEEEQEVQIILEDEAKNKTQITASVKLKKDEEAPVISGVYDIYVYKGDVIQYRKGIEVTDNRDKSVELVIDNSQVDRNTEGEYQITYTAEDKAGNVAKETAKVIILDSKNVSKEEVYALADKVLEQIVKEDMSDYDKAYAIYKWTRNNITYTGHTDPSDILAGAYQGFRYRTGDCFTYCSTAYVLYQRAGFQVMKVTRDENASELKHYWNYVNIGDGWYHCDSMLRQADFEPFMLTTEQMVEYTTKVMDRPDYYVYVEELYPPCGEAIRELHYTIPPKKEPETNPPTEEPVTTEEINTEIEETTLEEPTSEEETTSEIIWQSPPELVPVESQTMQQPETVVQPTQVPFETTTPAPIQTDFETTTSEILETTTVIVPAGEPETTTIIVPETEPITSTPEISDTP